ncbi:MAG: hypothetical protein RIG61_07480 [Deltaproteobacteria bacterium]
MTGKSLYAALMIGALALGACAGQQTAEEDGFDPSVCNNIPVGVERLAAADPEDKAFQISCADLERCTDIMAWDAPPDVPCTGP